jgi:hypothetical protein
MLHVCLSNRGGSTVWQGTGRSLNSSSRDCMSIEICSCAFSSCSLVKGHQDKDKAFEQLTIPEKFNVFADKLATYALDLAIITKAEPDPLLPLPRGSPYLIHEGKMQTSHERTLLHSSYAGYELKKYQLTKHNWTEK